MTRLTVWCVHASVWSEFYSLCLVYVCVCFCTSECVWGTEWGDAIGQSSLRSSRGDFTLREAVGECEEGHTRGVCCVSRLFPDILNVHKKKRQKKRKLSLRDATESVYIGGLCNRLLMVFGTLFWGSGEGWQIFSFRVTKKYLHTIFWLFFVPKTHATKWRPAS